MQTAGEKREGPKDASGENNSLLERIPFQIEADMRKGPPSSAVIRLHGAIESKQNRLVERIMNPLLKAKVDYVIVDFADVVSIEPGPVQTLINFAKQRKEAGLRHLCSLTALRSAVVEAIKAAKPEKIFVVYKHFHDAVKSLRLKGFPDLYIAGTRPTGLNMRAVVKVVPRRSRVALIAPYGYIQKEEAELLGKILRRVSLMEVHNVVIDMTGISYANSHALKWIVNCASAWERVFSRKAVALAGVKPGIRLALTTLGIAGSSFVCDTTDEALGKLEAEEKRSLTEQNQRPVKEKKEEAAAKTEVVEEYEAEAEEQAGGEEESEKEEKKEADKQAEIEERTKVEEDSGAEEESGDRDETGTEDETETSEESLKEESSFAVLASKNSSDTDTWILKNVKAILHKSRNKEQVQGREGEPGPESAAPAEMFEEEEALTPDEEPEVEGKEPEIESEVPVEVRTEEDKQFPVETPEEEEEEVEEEKEESDQAGADEVEGLVEEKKEPVIQAKEREKKKEAKKARPEKKKSAQKKSKKMVEKDVEKKTGSKKVKGKKPQKQKTQKKARKQAKQKDRKKPGKKGKKK